MSPLDDADLRNAFRSGMARLPGGICLITAAAADGGMAGLTVTSATSLSADPMSMLCCINKSSRSHDVILESGAFAANVVSAHDQALAAAFASNKTMEEKFATGAWLQRKTGSPILQTCAVAFDCRIRETVQASTHSLVIGDVVDMYLPEESPPGLVYWERGFKPLTR